MIFWSVLKTGHSKLTRTYMTERYAHDLFVHETHSDASISDNKRNEKIRVFELKATQLNEERKAVMKDLIQLANGPNGILNLRSDALETSSENSALSKKKCFLFVDTAMVCTMGKTKWKKNYLGRGLSDFTTIADEALAMVIVENIAPDLLELAKDTQSSMPLMVSRKTSKAKFTKSRSDTRKGTQHGWSLEGVKRYNELFFEIQQRRQDEGAKQLEKELMQSFMVDEMDDAEYDDGQEGRMGYNENYQDAVDMFEIHNSQIVQRDLGKIRKVPV